MSRRRDVTGNTKTQNVSHARCKWTKPVAKIIFNMPDGVFVRGEKISARDYREKNHRFFVPKFFFQLVVL